MQSNDLANLSISSLGTPKALRDEIYQVLLDVLLEGKIKSGEPISIDATARDLSVSPTPVREALAQLEHTGLVERAARKGYRVAPPLSDQHINELFDLRILLEVSAAERAFSNIEDLLPELEDALLEQERAAAQLEKIEQPYDIALLRPYFEADWHFHQVILGHSGNRYIAKSIESLSPSVHRMRQTVGRQVTDTLEAIREHREILDAFKLNDVNAVRLALTMHLAGVHERSMCRAEIA